MAVYWVVGNVLFVFLVVYLYVRHNASLKRFKLQIESNNLTLSNELQIAVKVNQELNKKLEIAERLSIVTKQTQNAVMLMDAEGNILWVNSSFTRMYEYSFQEFIDTLGNNIRKTSFNPKITERLYRCINLKQAVTYEALNITKSGKRLWTHTSLVPLLDNENQIIGMVTIDSDVHKRISASEEMVNHITSFQEKIEKISEQLEVMVELTDALFERIDKSQQRIERTGQVIGHVKGISDQTKILGINATIEANAAGIHGKGFRVIANEVVAISNLTSESLKEINHLISSVMRSGDKLGNEKERSEFAIAQHRSLIEELKAEIKETESVLLDLKEIS